MDLNNRRRVDARQDIINQHMSEILVNAGNPDSEVNTETNDHQSEQSKLKSITFHDAIEKMKKSILKSNPGTQEEDEFR